VIVKAGRDVWIGLVTVVLAAGYLDQVSKIRVGSNNAADVGPRAYPTLLGGVVLITGIALVVISLLAKRATSNATSETSNDTRTPSRQLSGRYVQATALAVITIAYLVVLEPLGFVIATAPYIAAAIIVVDGEHHYRGVRLLIPVMTGVLMSLVLHAMFDAGLEVPLPPGLFDPSWGM
jgi:putative tricarboxylic transport membrane protein